MGCVQSKQPLHAYYDPESQLVTFDPPKKHSAKKELVYVSSHDAKRFNPEDLCYVVSSAWHTYWIEFATRVSTQVPAEIDNHCLLDGDKNVRTDLKHRKHFRAINKPVWDYYFKLYGGGPVICFKVPAGFSEHEYTQGTWIKRIRLCEVAIVIFPSHFPSPLTEMAMVKNPMAQSNANMAANMMLNDLSKAKFKQAKEMEKEINASNAEAIGAMMAKDLGKKKMEEARELERQQHEATGGAVGHMFAGELANQMLTKSQKAKEQEQQASTESTAMLFAKGSVKKNFKEALARGDKNAARYFAATLLKNAWKGKKARERARLLRAEKERLLQEGMARKLQSRYRVRLARRRAQKLKEEKQKLREEACAIIVQSSWRIRKARQKAARLKLERERLLQEGAALKVQSRWRIRQSQRQVSRLRQEKLAAAEAAAAAKAAKYENAKLKVVQLLLLWRAKFLLRKRRMTQPQMLLISVKAARDINVGDVTSSDPYVVVHVESHHYPKSGAAYNLRKPNASTAARVKLGEEFEAVGATRSKCKTSVKFNTLAPDWNEDVLAVNVYHDDKLVLTMLDKDNFGKDKFLGQVVVDIPQYSKLYYGKPITLTRVPIDSLKVQMHDLAGRPMTFPRMESAGKGTMDFSFSLLPSVRNFSGWMMKLSSQVISFGSATFKPRFITLHNGLLQYHENELGLDTPRESILCKEVKRISYGPDNKSGHLTLHIHTSKTDWFLHWLEHESDATKARWIQTLELNCPHVAINGDEQGRSTSVAGARTESVASSMSNSITLNSQKSAGKILRRGSSLFAGSSHK